MLLFFLILFGFYSHTIVDSDGFMEANEVELTQTDEAAAYVTAHLGQPLPAGVVVNGVFQGGFQDTYVQIRMTVPETAVPDLYAALNVDPTSMRQTAPNPFPSDQSWWDIHVHDQVWTAPATFGSFDDAGITMAPDPTTPGQQIIYLGANDF